MSPPLFWKAETTSKTTVTSSRAMTRVAKRSRQPKAHPRMVLRYRQAEHVPPASVVAAVVAAVVPELPLQLPRVATASLPLKPLAQSRSRAHSAASLFLRIHRASSTRLALYQGKGTSPEHAQPNPTSHATNKRNTALVALPPAAPRRGQPLGGLRRAPGRRRRPSPRKPSAAPGRRCLRSPCCSPNNGKPLPQPKPSRATTFRWFFAGAMLFGGPAIGLLLPGRDLDSSALTIALALTPIIIAIASGALGTESSEGIAGRIWPSLAAVAGLLLVLVQPSLGDLRTDFLLLLAPLLTGLGAVSILYRSFAEPPPHRAGAVGRLRPLRLRARNQPLPHRQRTHASPFSRSPAMASSPCSASPRSPGWEPRAGRRSSPGFRC